MVTRLDRASIGVNGIEFFEYIDQSWKPKGHVGMLQEELLDFDNVITRMAVSALMAKEPNLPFSAWAVQPSPEMEIEAKRRASLAHSIQSEAQHIGPGQKIEWLELIRNNILHQWKAASRQDKPAGLTKLGGNNPWTKAHENYQFSVPHRLTIPNPDVYLAIRTHPQIYYPELNQPRGFLRHDLIQNFREDKLSTHKKVVWCPTGTDDDDAIVLPHQRLCFPFTVMQVTHQDARAEEVENCYAEAANASSRALAMLDYLVFSTPIVDDWTREESDLPPIVAFTYVGYKVKVWLTYVSSFDVESYHAPAMSLYDMRCIWQGDLREFWGAYQLCCIIDKMEYWFLHVYRPYVSECLNVWQQRANDEEVTRGSPDWEEQQSQTAEAFLVRRDKWRQTDDAGESEEAFFPSWSSSTNSDDDSGSEGSLEIFELEWLEADLKKVPQEIPTDWVPPDHIRSIEDDLNRRNGILTLRQQTDREQSANVESSGQDGAPLLENTTAQIHKVEPLNPTFSRPPSINPDVFQAQPTTYQSTGTRNGPRLFSAAPDPSVPELKQQALTHRQKALPRAIVRLPPTSVFKSDVGMASIGPVITKGTGIEAKCGILFGAGPTDQLGAQEKSTSERSEVSPARSSIAETMAKIGQATRKDGTSGFIPQAPRYNITPPVIFGSPPSPNTTLNASMSPSDGGPKALDGRQDNHLVPTPNSASATAAHPQPEVKFGRSTQPSTHSSAATVPISTTSTSPKAPLPVSSTLRATPSASSSSPAASSTSKAQQPTAQQSKSIFDMTKVPSPDPLGLPNLASDWVDDPPLSGWSNIETVVAEARRSPAPQMSLFTSPRSVTSSAKRSPSAAGKSHEPTAQGKDKE